MFDGIFLNKMLEELNILKTGRINKINESGDTDFIISIRANYNNYNLLISASSSFSRCHLTEKTYDFPAIPKSFTMLLRKHISGFFIKDIYTYSSDRVLIFSLEGFDELAYKKEYFLIAEIMGRYSNIILTDNNYEIIDSLKHDGIGEYNRTILPHATYVFPESNKLNPFDYTKDDLLKLIENKKLETPKDYMNTFNGVSFSIAEPIFKNDEHALNFYNYLHKEIIPSSFLNFNNKKDFYYNSFDIKPIKTYESLSKMLDDYYYQEDLNAKIKSKTNDLSSFINKEIKKLENKLIKRNKELNNTDEAENYKLYGELLLTYPNLKEKQKYIEILNYYNNELVKIPLDIKHTILENSNKYYKKYQKSKSAISYINEQIEKCENEITYFKSLSFQISISNINDALEIKEELINNKYLFDKENKNKKKQKPKLLTYDLNGTYISVGKNNVQNDYLTHKLSKPNELWFHVKDAPGSHVVLHKSEDITEDEIRCAALIAAFYSTLGESSSVPVDYTKIKNLKKVPKIKGSFVTMAHQKTIYIDPDKNIIDSLKVKK
ncbi:MAG: NFACT family protein [Acholeplasmatales bacterium]|nr:NFACT family protein [Acholeplasmatales bacterium]